MYRLPQHLLVPIGGRLPGQLHLGLGLKPLYQVGRQTLRVDMREARTNRPAGLCLLSTIFSPAALKTWRRTASARA